MEAQAPPPTYHVLISYRSGFENVILELFKDPGFPLEMKQKRINVFINLRHSSRRM